MPIKEISAESVRDKSIRHGHISTLHLWWARRPLPVCRAVIFASLVPDPLDNNCPQIFKEAIDLLLGKNYNIGDPYKPYDDIPFTSAVDKMEDNLRNRLIMFIGKFSEKYIQNERIGKETSSKDQISTFSLIKSESKNDKNIISKARKLIWVNHNAKNESNLQNSLDNYDAHFNKILEIEKELYGLLDRHIITETVRQKEQELSRSIDAFLEKMPKTFDPFTGGGAIPLESARLGCKSYGNDINPVAHIIQKASLEFPQKFGKRLIYSKNEFIKKYGIEYLINWCKLNSRHYLDENLIIDIPNILSFDVKFYAEKILSNVEKLISDNYKVDLSKGELLAYYWVRFAICSNPSCKAEVPLLKQFYLSKVRGRSTNDWVYIKPVINNNKIEFTINKGICEIDGFVKRGSFVCPCCGNMTHEKDLKDQFKEKKIKEKIVCDIYQKNGKKYYYISDNYLIDNFQQDENLIPEEDLPNETKITNTILFGYSKWKELFNDRQLNHIVCLIKELKMYDLYKNNDQYSIAITTYLGILIDRIIARNTSFGIWHTLQETIEHPFGRQAIFMLFDFPEMNPFSSLSSSDKNQLSQIIDYIETESTTFFSTCKNTSSGDVNQFEPKYLDSVITDPPYYDAIAYGDISDFFYVWLKKSIGEKYQYNFATPKTPKNDECTAIKSHHQNDLEKAKIHFELKLKEIFKSVETQTKDIVSIMFAHQSTEAWTTLCNSILGSKMNITGSWAIDTEVTGALKSNRAFLSSSVTVSARPSKKEGIGDYKIVKKAIEKTVQQEVEDLYRLGFRGADLLTACFGKAVSEFGIYEKVEKSDGSDVTITDLLEMARETAFNAFLKGFNGDDFTKFYIGWLQLFGFTTNEHNTAMRIVQIGLSININDLYRENILLHQTNESTLASFSERIQLNKNLGEKTSSTLIDVVHKGMWLYKGTSRNSLLEFISKVASSPESNFWRVLTSLCEILPNGTEDYIQASGLLINKESLIKESANLNNTINQQGQLEF